MQNMHKTTHDRPLTGVHWPIHRCRGSGVGMGVRTDTGGTRRKGGLPYAVVYITARVS